jgi:hypothetical protein
MSTSKPATREELVEYCLRQLGKPAIDIAVTNEQLEDRVDEALQQFQNYHFDATVRTYFTHQISCSEFLLTTNNAEAFAGNEFVTGQTSGAVCHVYADGSKGNRLRLKGVNSTFLTHPMDEVPNPTFIPGETIIGKDTGTVATLSPDATTFLKIGDIDNKFITIDDSIISVIRLLPFSDSKTSTLNPFDVKYQLRMNDLYDLYSTSMIYYTQVQQHLSLIDRLMVGEKPLRFSRHMNRLYVDMDWYNFVTPDQFLICEAQQIIDPEKFNEVYNDQFLKKYLTALIKRQWGQNLSLYDGVEIIGGVKVNGWQIFDQGNKEVIGLEDEMQTKWSEPPMMQIG